jgi:hypothetical protein
VSTDGREEILGFQAMGDVIELLAVASEEHGAGTRTITDADNVTLDELRSKRCRGERLVVAAMAGGGISDRPFVEA